MANIIVDGYNLIGTAHSDLEAARNELIRKLGRYADMQMHSISVVFDGWKDGRAMETKTRVGGVTVIYSSLGEKADEVIKNILSTAGKRWIAVSSDREIYNFAERRGCVALKSDEFEAKMEAVLERRVPAEPMEFPKDGEDIYRTQAVKKGNPRRLSKRDRKKMEALKKM